MCKAINVKLDVRGLDVMIDYVSIYDCMSDSGLRAIFNAELVNSCSVATNGTQMINLPACTWDRFKWQLIRGESDGRQRNV